FLAPERHFRRASRDGIGDVTLQALEVLRADDVCVVGIATPLWVKLLRHSASQFYTLVALRFVDEDIVGCETRLSCVVQLSREDALDRGAQREFGMHNRRQLPS